LTVTTTTKLLEDDLLYSLSTASGELEEEKLVVLVKNFKEFEANEKCPVAINMTKCPITKNMTKCPITKNRTKCPIAKIRQNAQ